MPLLAPAGEAARSIQLTIIIVTAAALCLPLFSIPHRIGDGSEYYAMYLAWKLTHWPIVTPELREAYNALPAHHYTHLWPFDGLLNAFPSLKIGEQRDYNHFSFYSLLAVVVGAVLPAKLGVDPTYAFYLLHYVLICVTVGVAYYLFGLPGITAVMVLFAASPALWYINKVHTEFFTIALSMIAVLALLGRRLMWSALALAIASTQNPSFAIVAVATGVAWVFDKEEKGTKAEAVFAVLSGVIVALHPLYYWSRHGGFSPQVFGPDGTSGDPLAFLYMPIWLIDPDIGLLPYWPLGLLLIVAGLFAWRSFDFRGGKLAAGLIVFYVLISLFAASQTSNLNSGGTTGVARYSTWLLCCFLPFLIVFARDLSFQPFVVRSVAYGLGLALMIYGAVKFQPNALEDYRNATPVSKFVQTYLSWLYRPPTEVFVERYAKGDQDLPRVAVVVGPDCSRAAFLARSLRVGTVDSRHCEIGLDPEKLLALMANRLDGRDGRKWQYTRLSATDVELVRLRPSSSYDAKDQSLRVLLRSGWARLEQWGIWSDGKEAVLAFPLSRADFPAGIRLTLHTGAFVPQGVRQSITPRVNGKALGVWLYDAESNDQLREIVIGPEDLPEKDPTVIRFHIPTAVSPRAFGSHDPRELGLAISKVSIAPLVP